MGDRFLNIELKREVFAKVRNMYHLSQKSLGNSMSALDLSPVQFGIVQSLPVEKSLSMSALIARVGCVPSNMTTMIQRMKRDELVETRKNPEDQRETLVSLTEKGIKIKNDIIPLYEKFLEKYYGGLTLEELMQLNYLLSKLEKGME